MAVIYFENMSPGMAAKLETRYRVRTTPTLVFKKLSGTTGSSGIKRGLFEKVGRTLSTRNI